MTTTEINSDAETTPEAEIAKESKYKAYKLAGPMFAAVIAMICCFLKVYSA